MIDTTTRCPSDETLMDFLEHRLHGKALQKIEQHLSACTNCREQVAVCADLLGNASADDSVSVPRRLTQRAVDSVLGLANQSLFHKLTHGARRRIAAGVVVLERLTWRPVPAAAALRGRSEALSPEVIRREKQFGDLRVDIEIEKSGADQALIRVKIPSSQVDTGLVRVALFSQDREVASALLGDVPVAFEEIPLGTYRLVFVKQNRQLGQYAFEIAGGA